MKSPLQIEEQMAFYGITRVPVDVFHFREFRYSNLEDAVAEATRQKLLADRASIRGGAQHKFSASRSLR